MRRRRGRRDRGWGFPRRAPRRPSQLACHDQFLLVTSAQRCRGHVRALAPRSHSRARSRLVYGPRRAPVNAGPPRSTVAVVGEAENDVLRERELRDQTLGGAVLRNEPHRAARPRACRGARGPARRRAQQLRWPLPSTAATRRRSRRRTTESDASRTAMPAPLSRATSTPSRTISARPGGEPLAATLRCASGLPGVNSEPTIASARTRRRSAPPSAR